MTDQNKFDSEQKLILSSIISVCITFIIVIWSVAYCAEKQSYYEYKAQVEPITNER